MDRRRFLQTTTGSVLLGPAFGVAGPTRAAAHCVPPIRAKAPFRVLFSNDTTNLRSCASPFHQKGEPFRIEMLEASVDETADTGIDVHMLQPGLGWVPWWKSQVYPADEHYRWWLRQFGGKPDGFAQYMIDGGDMVEVFVKRCRSRGLVPFVSLRMNDYHGKEYAHFSTDQMRELGSPFMAAHGNSRFYLDNRRYQVEPDPEDFLDCRDKTAYIRDKRRRGRLRDRRVLNWAEPAVRQHKLAMLRELAEGYDLAGLEMDFLRHKRLFRQSETTLDERVKIMTDFVSQVRRLLDRSTADGQRRWLAVRLPASLADHGALGLDLPRLFDAGLDIFNLSGYYCWQQQTDLPEIVRRVPEAAVYLELTHTTLRRWTNHPSGFDEPLDHQIEEFRMSTRRQMTTAAHLVYARGGSGVSSFNFVYYRPHGERGPGVFTEPPFDVFEDCHDPHKVAELPQHYFLARGRQLPRRLDRGKPQLFEIDMAPRRGGWSSDGRLRIQGDASLQPSGFTASINGRVLKPNDDVSEPYPNPYVRAGALGRPDELRAWTVPRRLLADGPNRIELTLTDGPPVRIIFIDLAIA